jgi:hypothetical protein
MKGQLEAVGEHGLHHRHQLVPARLPTHLRLDVEAILAGP